jgi:hypothetical protein
MAHEPALYPKSSRSKEKNPMRRIHFVRGLLVAVLTTTLVAFTSGALAQGDNGQGDGDGLQEGTRDQTRGRTEDHLQDGAREQTRDRDRIHARIDADPGMTDEERARMHANLDECLALGLPASSAEPMFPGNGAKRQISTALMLRLQNRVMTAAREGLAVESVLAKFQEGRTKGVPEPLLEQACERMENHLREANRTMIANAAAGAEPPVDPAQKRRMQGEMSRQMWRGMNEEGYAQLRERSRRCLRDGGCDAVDLVAAAEVATRLMEAGVHGARALEFAGDAVQSGYRYQEMRQIQIMVAARHHRGESVDDFVASMERCVGAGMGVGEMYSYMIRHGWMGPGDMHGPGGDQPADQKGHGGGHEGGMDGGHEGNDNKGKRQGGGNQ